MVNNINHNKIIKKTTEKHAFCVDARERANVIAIQFNTDKQSENGY